MTECVTSKLPKWPFFLGDLLLVAFAGVIIFKSSGSIAAWQVGYCFAALTVGAGLSVFPFVREYRAAVHLAEAHTLAAAMVQLKEVTVLKSQIANATAQWEVAQEHSLKTVRAAEEIANRMKAEAQEFFAFLEKANDREKAHLRLEVEKLRRAEGDWIQVTVRILDHIFALNRAATQSGQPALISQLQQFQHVCRDFARRVGLVAMTPRAGDPFDPQAQQLADGQSPPPAEGAVLETLAPGYSFQGQLVRRALVSVRSAVPNDGTPTEKLDAPSVEVAVAQAEKADDHESLNTDRAPVSAATETAEDITRTQDQAGPGQTRLSL